MVRTTQTQSPNTRRYASVTATNECPEALRLSFKSIRSMFSPSFMSTTSHHVPSEREVARQALACADAAWVLAQTSPVQKPSVLRGLDLDTHGICDGGEN